MPTRRKRKIRDLSPDAYAQGRHDEVLGRGVIPDATMTVSQVGTSDAPIEEPTLDLGLARDDHEPRYVEGAVGWIVNGILQSLLTFYLHPTKLLVRDEQGERLVDLPRTVPFTAMRVRIYRCRRQVLAFKLTAKDLDDELYKHDRYNDHVPIPGLETHFPEGIDLDLPGYLECNLPHPEDDDPTKLGEVPPIIGPATWGEPDSAAVEYARRVEIGLARIKAMRFAVVQAVAKKGLFVRGRRCLGCGRSGWPRLDLALGRRRLRSLDYCPACETDQDKARDARRKRLKRSGAGTCPP